ncbi:cytosine permease, partial [candidate division KSB1 bacterium]|nr:cytosine permease [candidate division KSB1 bacterium]
MNPQKISFRMRGLIAGCVGILIMPWKLLDMYLTWLITYSGLLGAVGGVILCDYVFIRKGNLNLEDLYQE